MPTFPFTKTSGGMERGETLLLIFNKHIVFLGAFIADF